MSDSSKHNDDPETGLPLRFVAREINSASYEVLECRGESPIYTTLCNAGSRRDALRIIAALAVAQKEGE